MGQNIKIKCEICGKGIAHGISYYSLFGQKACSEKCMKEISKKRDRENK